METTMQITAKKQTLNIAEQIHRDPKFFFRAAEVLAFDPDPNSDQKDHVVLFDPATERGRHPLSLIEISKVIFGIPNRGGIHSLWITNATSHVPIEGKIVNLARQVKPGYLPFPAYSHGTWRHVARVTNSMKAVYWNGRQAMSLSSKALGIETIHGMQGIFTASGVLVFHVFGAGSLHEVRITPDHMASKTLPCPIRIDDGVNCALSIPAPEGFKMLVGKDDGLYLDGKRLQQTKGQRVRHISAASEIRRVFYRANDGETWGFQFQEGCVASDIVQVDASRDCQMHFAGTTFSAGQDGTKNQTLALYKLSDDPDGKHWIHERILVPLPRALLAAPEIALTL